MPAQSQAQFKMIQAKRSQYGTKAKTPDKWKWIWDEKWTDVNYKKLPTKKEEIEKVREVIRQMLGEIKLNETKELIIDKELDNFVKSIVRKYSNKITLDMDHLIINGKHFLKLVGIVIKPKFRSEGLGSLIMKDLITYADKKGYKMILEASDIFGSDPERLISFYKRFGFTYVGGKDHEMIR